MTVETMIKILLQLLIVISILLWVVYEHKKEKAELELIRQKFDQHQENERQRKEKYEAIKQFIENSPPSRSNDDLKKLFNDDLNELLKIRT